MSGKVTKKPVQKASSNAKVPTKKTRDSKKSVKDIDVAPAPPQNQVPPLKAKVPAGQVTNKTDAPTNKVAGANAAVAVASVAENLIQVILTPEQLILQARTPVVLPDHTFFPSEIAIVPTGDFANDYEAFCMDTGIVPVQELIHLPEPYYTTIEVEAPSVMNRVPSDSNLKLAKASSRPGSSSRLLRPVSRPGSKENSSAPRVQENVLQGIPVRLVKQRLTIGQARAVAFALQHQTNICSLTLHDTGLSPLSISVISQGIAKNKASPLRHVAIDFNPIMTSGPAPSVEQANVFGLFLDNLPNVQSLSLRGNGLTDFHAECLFSQLAKNTTLTALNLFQNCMTVVSESTATLVRDAIRINTTLISLSFAGNRLVDASMQLALCNSLGRYHSSELPGEDFKTRKADFLKKQADLQKLRLNKDPKAKAEAALIKLTMEEIGGQFWIIGNRTLRNLNLSHNCLTNVTCDSLCTALGAYTPTQIHPLLKLSLQGNQMTPESILNLPSHLLPPEVRPSDAYFADACSSVH